MRVCHKCKRFFRRYSCHYKLTMRGIKKILPSDRIPWFLVGLLYKFRLSLFSLFSKYYLRKIYAYSELRLKTKIL